MRIAVSRTALGAISSLCVIGAAPADETVLQEVVVTASFNRSLLTIAQPAAVLGGDDLSRELASSLGETLSSQLGVSSSYFGPTASRPVIRGLGGYRVQTLQDGISSLDVGSLSDDHATTVDPALADQIEVLKGPATLLYGSGASGGLINVVTQRLPTQAAATVGLAELRGGTAADELAGTVSITGGTQTFAVHGDAFRSKSAAIDIPGATLSDRLINALIANGDSVETVHGRISNAWSRTQGGAIGGSWLGQSASVGAAFSRYGTQYGIPAEETAFIDMEQERVDAKAQWSREAGWLRGLQLRGAHNDYTHTEFEAPGEPGTVFSQDAYEVRASAEHAHDARWRGTFGAQMTHLDFVAAGEEAFVPASLTESLGLFVLEELDMGSWTLSLGARYERQEIAVAAGLAQFDEDAFSFAAGAVHSFSDTDSLAFNLTHSARHPQSTELYADGPHLAAQRYELGDAGLDTEKANTVDVTWRRASDSLSWSIGAFFNDYDKFVFAAPTGNIQDDLPEVQYSQSAATLWGVEAEIWIPVYRSEAQTLQLRWMSDWVRGERKGDEPLPQMPPRRLGVGLHYDRGGLHAEIEGLHHDRQDRIAANELVTDSYVMLNADISWQLDGFGDWFLFLRGTNLLDEDARQHTSSLKDVVPLPGRSLNGGIRATF